MSFNLWASYLPESKIGQDTSGVAIHSKKSKCEVQYSEPCISIKEMGNHSYSKVIQSETLESNNEPCVPLVDCDEKYIALNCDEGWSKSRGLLSVYCYKYTPRHVGHDLALKSSYEALEQEKEDAKQLLKDTFKNKKGVGFSNMTKEEQDSLIEYLIDKVN